MVVCVYAPSQKGHKILPPQILNPSGIKIAALHCIAANIEIMVIENLMGGKYFWILAAHML